MACTIAFANAAISSIFLLNGKAEEVIHVDDPIIGDMMVTTSCTFSKTEVNCTVIQGQVPTVANRYKYIRPFRECSFRDLLDPRYESRSWKGIDSATGNYIEKPYIVALDNDRVVLAWMEEAAKIRNLFYIKLKNLRFQDCSMTETRINLGIQMGEAYIDIEGRESGYDLLVGNYKDACNGKMCSMYIDSNGYFDKVYTNYHQPINIVTRRIKLLFEPPNNPNYAHATHIQMTKNVKVFDNKVRNSVWLAEYHGYGGKFRSLLRF